MRLLYVIDQILFRGGTEGHLWELAHGMAARGHQVTVLSLEDGPPYGPAFQQSRPITYQSLRIQDRKSVV